MHEGGNIGRAGPVFRTMRYHVPVVFIFLYIPRGERIQFICIQTCFRIHNSPYIYDLLVCEGESDGLDQARVVIEPPSNQSPAQAHQATFVNREYVRQILNLITQQL